MNQSTAKKSMNNFVFLTNGFETYQNPQLDEELCKYYAAEKSNSRIDPQGKDGERLAKRGWNNKEMSRKPCKQCNGRGYQMYTKSNLAWGLACGCISPYLTDGDENVVDEPISNNNPLDS